MEMRLPHLLEGFLFQVQAINLRILRP